VGAAVSLFEHFPITFFKTVLVQPLGKAVACGKPAVVATSEETPRILSMAGLPQPKSQTDSTQPQYVPDGKKVKNPERPIDTQGDQAQHSVTSLNAVPGASEDGWASRHASIPSKVAGSKQSHWIRELDDQILKALQEPGTALLTSLLDAHPHAACNPADRSIGAFISNFFRHVACWFNSDAYAWQGKQAVILLNEAARVGNADAIRILLNRGMDLQRDTAIIKKALRIAVTSGKTRAAGVLLREVLTDEPRYVKDPELTIAAAHAEHTNVLTFLVDQGMALPAQSALLRYISHGANLAHQALLDAVGEKFREFTSKGEVESDMREYLMDKGMYRVLADLVMDAAALAAASPSWNQPGANRTLLFANALDQSAIKQKDPVQRARDASGNPDLFDKLLSPQLGMLIAYSKFPPVGLVLVPGS
jgi:hypothetical protein